MFQKKIIDKYLSKIDRLLLADKYSQFETIFSDKQKQENIRASKEEQYQEGFIRDLFCAVLGYTISPEPNFNIITELKNETKNKNNARKADGAIIIGETTKAVIELKGTNTQDLDTVAKQAFDYKSHHENCNYVIVANFERLRLYVETQSDFEEFNLFNLSKERFDLLYLLLQLENIMNDIPLKLKHETLTEEKEITNNFYSDYSIFKRCLFEDLCENNPETDKLLLFKKTQKLLDRILFILFCEDRNLLPTNSVVGIINDWKALKKMGYPQPLYNLFKTFFERINTGFKNEDDHTRDIFAYNGGLFKPDEILDSVKIGDDVLYLYSQRLANYDFQSQISVDILGRIFENSLTEIEEVQNEIENEKQGIKVENNNIGKRKKDGVFYTPEYITKYIVENTIGKLCETKKEELKINDDEFIPSTTTTGRKPSTAEKNRISELDKRLETYREYLLSLKILDPACGSGAFLNAALKFLRKEHTLIDYFWSKIHKGELNFSEIDNSILENNIYGVDINEESIEIAKLSLWLSTAKKNRKLSTLANNIKCGNSLIDDPNVAGDKAFDWQKEFPEVFEKGGFDVVIGNPPYVNIKNVENAKNALIKEFYKSHYKSAKVMFDLYSLFTEKSAILLKPNGFFGFIFSNSWLGSQSFYSFREFLAKDVTVTELVDLPDKVFTDATVKTCICFYINKRPNENSEIKISECNDQQIFISKGFTQKYKDIISSDNLSFTMKRNINFENVKTIKLGNIAKFTAGISTANDKKFVLKEKIDDDCYLFLRGRDLAKWKKPIPAGDYMWYKPDLMAENVNARPRVKNNFLVPEKILIQDVATEISATLDTESFLCNKTVNVLYEISTNYNIKYILALLNSKLANTWIKQVFPTGLHIEVSQLILLPIPEITSDEQKPFIDLADKMLSLNSDLQKKTSNFLKVAKETFNIEKPSAKLETFYDLTFEEFIKELKQKITPKIKLEWLELFEEQKAALQKLKEEIAATDRQINSLVYKLYGLTDEEIKIVESEN
ncbi:MAG: DNA methyltransferase [Treponemataceae bacterium]|nr:N-6 DNA methylase [Spirochaetales bacterium]MDY6032185.1 DNA methyltransferase [Treponemataceae bacterium]